MVLDESLWCTLIVMITITILFQLTKPLLALENSLLQFSDLSWPYFDHTFSSGKHKNEQTTMQMVSNEILWHLSIVFAKMIILNHLTEPLEASNYNFLQLSALIYSYFDHIFAFGKPRINCTSMQIVSNVSLWYPSMILIKMVFLN